MPRRANCTTQFVIQLFKCFILVLKVEGIIMTTLIIGLILFLGVHSTSIFANAWRDKMAARLGNGWRGIYSVLSLIGFVLLIKGFGEARLTPQVIYTSPMWMHYIMYVLMLPVFPFLLATYLPGKIKAAIKHPMLNAVKFWAFAHLLVNGSLHEIIFFGSFLLWAIADRISVKHRPARPLATAPASKYNDWIAVIGGLALYVLMVHGGLHYKLIGVMPL
jgi:uncharacterized membrane protein